MNAVATVNRNTSNDDKRDQSMQYNIIRNRSTKPSKWAN